MTTLLIFCDGSSRNQGASNCEASAGVCHVAHAVLGLEKNSISKQVLIEPSNQSAELVAMSMAFDMVKTYIAQKMPLSTVVIVTDSLYAIKCVSEWLPNWKANGWKTAKREPVKHKAIIQDIDTSVAQIKSVGIVVMLKHVRSHRACPAVPEDLGHRVDNVYHLWFGNNWADTVAYEGLPKK